MKTNLKYHSEAAFDQISSLQLPNLPAGTPFLLKSLTDENIDFVDLATILEKFPSIAGKLISMANSVWSAPVSSVTSLEASCARLGFAVVRSTSIALAVAAPFNASKCPSFDSEYFWSSALLSAEAASRLALLAVTESACEPSTARAAGLLHNLGLLWLVDQLPAETGQALTMINTRQAASLRQAMNQVHGYDQMEAGGYLARQWSLPSPLLEAMANYADPDPAGEQCAIVATVGLAVKLVSAVMRGESCADSDKRLLRLGITAEAFEGIGELLTGQLVKTRQIAKVLIG